MITSVFETIEQLFWHHRVASSRRIETCIAWPWKVKVKIWPQVKVTWCGDPSRSYCICLDERNTMRPLSRRLVPWPKNRIQDPQDPTAKWNVKIQDLQDLTAKQILKGPRSTGYHGKMKYQDLRSARSHGKTNPQGPRSTGYHDKMKYQDRRSAGSHSKTSSWGPRSTGYHGKMKYQDQRSAGSHGKTNTWDPRSTWYHGKTKQHWTQIEHACYNELSCHCLYRMSIN